MLSDVGSGGLASVLSAQSSFFIKGNWIYTVTRDHVERYINILLTRDILFGFDIRQ